MKYERDERKMGRKPERKGISERAKWIWPEGKYGREEYASFEKRFEYREGNCWLRICAETDYIAYLNGERIAFGQFPGYPFEKYYDEVELTGKVERGENLLQVTVRYEGADSFTHIDDGPGLLFEILEESETIGISDERVEAWRALRYVNHAPREINFALGHASDMAAGSHMACRVPCAEKKRDCRILPRPVEKLVLAGKREAMSVRCGERIYDLGFETAGYLYLQVRCQVECVVKVAWGEHLEDGKVRYLVGSHDFSLDFYCLPGENAFEQFFVRLGCRYLQVLCKEEAEVVSIGLYEAVYPVTEKGRKGNALWEHGGDQPAQFRDMKARKGNVLWEHGGKLTETDRQIYAVCVRTLRLCMHEHYEDCPWREQALYALDARNQMLCGYDVFEETGFQRANLVYLARDRNPNGLLKLVNPRKEEGGIPFFSLMYVVAVYEYIEATGDRTVLDETWEAVREIMGFFGNRRNERGLIPTLDTPFWNFYEWSYYSAGDEGGKEYLILNCAYLYAAERFLALCEWKGREEEGLLSGCPALRQAVRKYFYRERQGLYCVSTEHEELFSQLGNAFAVLTGLGDKRVEEALKTGEGMIPATLAMRSFVYDALLQADPANGAYVLEDIRSGYGRMLEAGATSFWETEEGASAFEGTGSLCHAWSAVPILYYNRILKNGSVCFPISTFGGA